jgi:hypothetical protein
MTGGTKAPDITGMLAARVDRLAPELQPAGHREGHEWRCGSLAGEPRHGLGCISGLAPRLAYGAISRPVSLAMRST